MPCFRESCDHPNAKRTEITNPPETNQNEFTFVHLDQCNTCAHYQQHMAFRMNLHRRIPLFVPFSFSDTGTPAFCDLVNRQTCELCPSWPRNHHSNVCVAVWPPLSGCSNFRHVRVPRQRVSSSLKFRQVKNIDIHWNSPH